MRDPADISSIGRLKRRADFVRASKGKRWHGKAMTLQANRRDDTAPDPEAARLGFTLTRKVGCAVIRNRARRRLREAARLTTDLSAQPHHDYVIVGRIEAIRLPFSALQTELLRAFRSVHGEAKAASRRAAGRPQRTMSKP